MHNTHGALQVRAQGPATPPMKAKRAPLPLFCPIHDSLNFAEFFRLSLSPFNVCINYFN
jgi:hypothetical protein